jgi:hypothetical protein
MFNINLSSERVRLALWFLEGIRQGQPLGALLGYRFERAIHEENQSELELDQYIQPLRDLFPLRPSDLKQQPPGQPSGAGGGGAGTGGRSQETIEARDVVNGLSMLKEWRKGTGFPFDKLGIAGNERRSLVIGALTSQLQALDDTLDAISDLVIAESVFQMVQGNYSGMAANLEAYSTGERPPEPAIAKTPRSGIRITHRVLLILPKQPMAGDDDDGGGGGNDPLAPWAKSTDNPRAKAEPALNTWLAKMLGDPTNIVCKVSYKISSSSSASERRSKHVNLADLGLCPLDFLELSMASGEQAQGEIDSRLADFILSEIPDRRDLEILYAVSNEELQNNQISFADALEFARKLHQIISGARELTPHDLLIPEEAEQSGNEIGGTHHPIDIKEFHDRVQGAYEMMVSVSQNLAAAIETSSLDDLLDVLKKASLFGVVGAFPEEPNNMAGPNEQRRYIDYLKQKAELVQAQLKKRLEKADTKKYEDGDTALIKMKTSIEKAKEIFGPSFKILPKFLATNHQELVNSLDNSSKLLNSNDDAPIPWFQQVAKVRPSLSKYEDGLAYAEALGTAELQFKVAQIPFDVNEKWVALPFDINNESDKPKSGKVSLVISMLDSPLDFSEKICGLALDDWVEVVPEDKETTGVAFNYNIPNAEAPQALLLAVPPAGNARNWDIDDVIATINETLDLAKIRTIDRDMLGTTAQFLPALFFTTTVQTDGDVVKPVVIDTDFKVNNKLMAENLDSGGGGS